MVATIIFSLFITLSIGLISWKVYTKRRDHIIKVKYFEELDRKKEILKQNIGSIGSPDIGEKTREFMESNEMSISDKALIINGIVAEEVTIMLEDNYFSDEEQNQLTRFMGHFPDSIWEENVLEKIHQARVIKALIDDEPLPKAPSFETSLLLSKNEILIYIFDDVRFAQERTSTIYVGGSRGISVRVAKGVYFRSSGSRGYTEKTSAIQTIDTGELAITTQNIYFRGRNRSFKIDLKKVINLEAFSDGIKVEKDGVSFKPYYFLDVDVWFAGNLISLLTGKLR